MSGLDTLTEYCMWLCASAGKTVSELQIQTVALPVSVLTCCTMRVSQLPVSHALPKKSPRAPQPSQNLTLSAQARSRCRRQPR